jgi:NAD(P)-dependent dehydrogenase (short-subunit alcohol dehydrogenase family)
MKTDESAAHADQRHRPSYVITGVSTGIGYATVRYLLDQGVTVFGSVRTSADADRLQNEFGPKFRPLIFDVTDAAAIQRAALEVEERLAGNRLAGLLNNAGMAVVGPSSHIPVERLRLQLEVNLIGQMTVTQAFLPALGTDRNRAGPPGRIVNLSSVCGKIASPFMGPYCASKFGLEALSDCLRRELSLFGIKVIVIEPGAVVTPIWGKAEGRVLADYPGTPYQAQLERFAGQAMKEAETGFQPEKVAELIWRALTTPRPRARYAIVPRPWIEWILPRMIPTSWLDEGMRQYFGFPATPGRH